MRKKDLPWIKTTKRGGTRVNGHPHSLKFQIEVFEARNFQRARI